MYQIDAMSRTPVYEQIADMTEKLVLSGVLKPNDMLPSVRSLSAELKTNPNTVQKAFTELDFRGIVRTVPGRGCFIRPDVFDALKKRAATKLAELCRLCREIRAAGVPLEDITTEINKIYNGGEENGL